MSRSPIAFLLFVIAAMFAMVGMVVSGASRLHRTPRAVAMSAAVGRGYIDAEPAPGVGIPPGYRGTNARNYMRMRLHELTVAEENYYNETNSYTTDLSKLMLMKRTGDVVVLNVTFAGAAGWSAEATHPTLPGKSCVVYAGPANLLTKVPETMADHTRPLGERDLVCDKP